MVREIEIVRPVDELRQRVEEKEVACSHEWRYVRRQGVSPSLRSSIVRRSCIVCDLVEEYPPVRLVPIRSLMDEFDAPSGTVEKWVVTTPVDEDDEPVELLYYLFGKRIPFGLGILVGFILLILFVGLFGLGR